MLQFLANMHEPLSVLHQARQKTLKGSPRREVFKSLAQGQIIQCDLIYLGDGEWAPSRLTWNKTWFSWDEARLQEEYKLQPNDGDELPTVSAVISLWDTRAGLHLHHQHVFRWHCCKIRLIWSLIWDFFPYISVPAHQAKPLLSSQKI